MKRIALILPLALAAFGLARPAAAGTDAFDASMQPVLAQYLKIQEALASDTLDGVKPAAQRLEKLAAKVDPSTVSGEHASHYENVPANLTAAAGEVAGAKDLAATREAFKALSKPMAMWVSMSEPAGVNVAYCSMAKGSWVQKGTDLENPYYGASMLTCGEIVGGAAKGHGDMKGHGHDGHGDHGSHGGHGSHMN